MKSLIALALLSASCLLAQTPSNITITVAVDAKTYTVSLTASAISSLAQQLAAANADSSGSTQTSLVLSSISAAAKSTYADIGDLIVKHLAATLVMPAVTKYPPAAVAQAAATVATARTALQQAVSISASGAITVSGQ